MRHSGTVLGSTLLGARLRNSAGEDLGRIEEFVVDPLSGDIRSVVVHSNLHGDRLFAVPWEAVTVPQSRDYMLVDAGRQFVERAPSFDRNHWPDMNDDAWLNRNRTYWGITAAGPAVRPSGPQPVRRTFGLGSALVVLALLGLLGFAYMVSTRGWDRASTDIVGSAQTVAYAMKESSADVALTTKVKTALSLSKRVPGWGINVDSNDGVVTLRGEVHDADVKSLAEEITRDTNGVTAVRNELSVNAQIAAEAETQQMRDRVGDLEMRYSIHDALVKDPQLRLEDINVEVMNKAVTLSGTVTTSDQKYLAEQIAKKQSGQQTVSNRLEVLQ